MRYFKNVIAALCIILFVLGCESEALVPKGKVVAYILLATKTEMTVRGSSRYTIKTQYEYDSLPVIPRLQREIGIDYVTEYSYPTVNKVVAKSIDNLSNQVINTTTYQIDPTTNNVLNQTDDFGTYKFEYNTDGNLTKSDFDEGVVFEYKEGNLSKKKLQDIDYSSVEEFTYGLEALKLPINIPFFYGKPNKNLLIKQVTITEIVKSPATTETQIVKTTLDSRGYVITERRTFENGEYVETKYTYKIFKK